MKANTLPSRERLDELLSFDPATGEIRWKVSRQGIKIGDEAGNIWTNLKTGIKYRHIRIDGIKYLAHRLAHYYYTDEQPPEVDHKNGNSLDNRKDNLRSANHKSNTNNAKMQHNNTSGVTGVSYFKRDKLWSAQFGSNELQRLNKTRKYFDDFFEAVCQRKAWENQFGMTEAKKHRAS
jgi:hypothetical protein